MNKAMEILLADESAVIRHLLAPAVQCLSNLGVSFDNEGNATEAKSYFSPVIARCENLNENGISSDAMSIILALQHHYYDRPRTIDALDPKIDKYLAH